MYKRRALLAATPVLLVGGCFGSTGNSQAAQDAKVIVNAITPIAQNAAGFGAAPATGAVISQSLAKARGEAATMATQFTPGLLDVQEFLAAAETLLKALSGLSNLPPAAVGTIDAASALLPTFADIADEKSTLPVRMTPEQARAVLGNGTATASRPPPPEPAPLAPPPAAPTASVPKTGRFHVSANDFEGAVSYEFWDNGQMIEKGTVASLAVLETRFAAFKAQRLRASP